MGLTRKQIIASVASVLVLLAVLIFSLSSGSDNENESQSTLVTQSPNTTKSGPQTTTTTLAINDIVREQYSRQDYERYLSLPTTGELTPGIIFDYMSPRYEAILGGDPSSPIPMSELNKPENSDLPEQVFNLARTTAINITKAEITGEGTSRWPNYFEGVPKGVCYNFRAPYAGATKLPIASSDQWIVTYVRYSATCPSPSGPANINQIMNVYFHNVNGTLTPKVLSQVPTN